jgi:hypothetical protein
MNPGAGGTNIEVIFKVTVLSVVILVLVVVLLLAFGWLRGKREENPGIGDINWDEEKRILEALAAEKKAKRAAEKAAAKNPPQVKSAADDYEIPDPLEGWNDDEALRGDGSNISDDEDRG